MTVFRALAALVCVLLAPGHGLALELAGDDGRTVRFEKPFARVVSLYAGHTENLLAMGAGETLVGATEPVTGPQAPSHGVAVVSARDSAEALAALNPDLVLARPMHLAAHPGLVEQLSGLGIAVVCLQPGSPEALEGYWLALGRLVGREAAAQDMARRFGQDMADLEATVRAIPQAERRRVFFESIHRQMKTVSKGSMAAFVLARAGAVNLAEDAQAVSGSNIAHFGLERLVAMGGQVDAYLAQVGPMNPVSLEEIQSTPGFGAVKAVREGQVFLVDEALVSRPTPRLALAARTVGALLYPKHFPQPKGQVTP